MVVVCVWGGCGEQCSLLSLPLSLSLSVSVTVTDAWLAFPCDGLWDHW